MLDRLQQVVSKLCVDWDAERIEMNGEVDHVHFLLEARSGLGGRGGGTADLRAPGRAEWLYNSRLVIGE